LKKKILVVDDEKPILKIIVFNLKKNNYDVIEAYNGEEAIEKAKKMKPDLILLDVMMPKKTGFEVCKELAEDEVTRNIPIIMLTAKGQEFDRQKGLSVGAIDYLTKPFSPRGLIEKVKEILG